ncbi:alpha/beta hydrolase [Salinarimonas sp. NSM]|uniref:alpha/beta hydrolase n=1 Tax=Salinarimonas sp. NSM TaxID=3458003 RepID=UPI0040366453
MTAETDPFLLEGEGTAILLIHGFTGTPQGVRPVGERLHHLTGATVHAPLLAGHGGVPEDLRSCSYRDWVASAEGALEGLAARHGPVLVVGLSMGGTIALNLCARRGDLVLGVAAINASTGVYKPTVAAQLLDADPSGDVPGIGSDIKRAGVREIAYARIPVPALQNRYVLACATGHMLPLITRPVLVLQSREDHVVSPENALRIVGSVAASRVRLAWLENSYHVATLDHDRDRVADEIAAFRHECLAASETGALVG